MKGKEVRIGGGEEIRKVKKSLKRMSKRKGEKYKRKGVTREEKGGGKIRIRRKGNENKNRKRT